MVLSLLCAILGPCALTVINQKSSKALFDVLETKLSRRNCSFRSKPAKWGRPPGQSDAISTFLSNANQAPETPGTDEVVETFVRLIEMPNGQRPFRTVPTPALQPLLDPYNAAASQAGGCSNIQRARALGVTDVRLNPWCRKGWTD